MIFFRDQTQKISPNKALLISIFTLISVALSTIYAQNTYGLVIGVSDYREEGITDLQYAHRDAELFASYLMSPAGGNVPRTNIKLLTENLIYNLPLLRINKEIIMRSLILSFVFIIIIGAEEVKKENPLPLI